MSGTDYDYAKNLELVNDPVLLRAEALKYRREIHSLRHVAFASIFAVVLCVTLDQTRGTQGWWRVASLVLYPALSLALGWLCSRWIRPGKIF